MIGDMGQDGQENRSAHERQIAGLRPPWRPGQSGNPGGRPKGVRYPAEHLALTLPGMAVDQVRRIATGTEDCTDVNLIIACRQTAVAAGWIAEARAIDTTKAAAEVMDRTSGKPAQQVIVSAAPAAPDGAALLALLRDQMRGRALAGPEGE